MYKIKNCETLNLCCQQCPAKRMWDWDRATLTEVDVFAPQHILKFFVEGFVPIFFVNKCVSSVTCDTFHHNHSPSQHTFLHLFHYTPAPRRGRGVYCITSVRPAVRPRYFSSHFSQSLLMAEI